MKKVLLAALCLAVFFGCGKRTIPKEKLFPVRVLKIKQGNIASVITLAGSVDSKVHSLINSQVSGTVVNLNVKEGDSVSAGQILASIMPHDQQDMIGQAQANLENIKREPAGKNENKKLKETRLNEAVEQLEAARKLYKPVPVVSPIYGTVLSKTIEAGNNVSLNQTILEVANLSQLIVRSAVFETYISRIRLGQKIPVIIHALKDEIFTGTLSVINPGLSLDSRTANIEISLPGSAKVKPGMTAVAKLELDSKTDTVKIPADAVVVTADGSKIIFICKDGVVKQVKIATGIESESEIEVTAGVVEGDLLVVLGQDVLQDGQKVRILEDNKPAEKTEKAEKKVETK